MKYKFTGETKVIGGITLNQIQATSDFGIVKSGDIGGWIEKERNLSQYGNAWVYCNAEVSGDAQVSGNARVYDSKDYLTIGPIGDNRFITLTKSNQKVKAGCFHGDYSEFKTAIDEKYKGEGDYYMVLPLIKSYFKI